MSDEINLVKEIFHKMDSLDQNVDKINVTLAVQSEQLGQHMKRSDSIEKHVELLEKELKPIQQHVNRVNALILLLGGLIACIGAVEGILKIFNLFSKFQ